MMGGEQNRDRFPASSRRLSQGNWCEGLRIQAGTEAIAPHWRSSVPCPQFICITSVCSQSPLRQGRLRRRGPGGGELPETHREKS